MLYILGNFSFIKPLYCIFIRGRVNLPNGYFVESHSRPTGWTHVLLNYIGPNNGEGYRIYMDGSEVGSDTAKTVWSGSTGDGRVVIGRYYTDQDKEYSSVHIDELIYFNNSLTDEEIEFLGRTV